MTITINGTTGITNDGGYTGDGVVFADTTPANTLVTTTGGNVGVGTSTPTAKLNIVGNTLIPLTNSYYCYTANYGMSTGTGLELFCDTGDVMRFITGGKTGTERGRFDSSGNFLVGTNSATAKFVISKSSGDGVWMMQGYTDGTEQLRINNNGSIQNSLNSYGGLSDIKLKENIVDATPKLEELNQVRIVNYNLIGSEQKQIGVIAQELEQIFPGMVEDTPDRDEEGNDLGTVTKGVKYSVFVPMLIKAIQEQQAMIAQLQADVAVLKGTQP